ncbi:MAG: FHA domain-containing protein [SAR324 cluster bacterium]|uniref:FHA domain-containing protein n=1 Tax=SAR324 cluster bacterium TaxID=2024889 RepID=A0A7X9FR86_9DELT|nr:FHA domain-containing protein [SAR324 cluster bacterium]
MSINAKLVLTYGKHKGKEFPLKDGENLIGRIDPDSDEALAIDLDEDDIEAKVSRQHAVVCLEDDKATLEDLGSLNGTFVKKADLRRLESGEKYTLRSGDEFIIGKVSLRYEEY